MPKVTRGICRILALVLAASAGRAAAQQQQQSGQQQQQQQPQQQPQQQQQVVVQPQAPAPAPAPAPVAVAEPAPAAVAVEPPAIDIERFAVVYSPEVLMGNTSFDKAFNKIGNGQGVHNVGFEISTLAGWFARYHAQLDFTHGYGANGVRLEPLAFGLSIPLVPRNPSFGLEIEPLISLVDGIVLFTNDDRGENNATFLLGSGAEVQLNLLMGPIYMFLSPVGIEVRWLESTTGHNANTWGGADPFWRFRVGLGVRY